MVCNNKFLCKSAGGRLPPLQIRRYKQQLWNMRSTNLSSSLRLDNGAKKRRKYRNLTNREQTTISKSSWCQPRGFLGGTPKRLLLTLYRYKVSARRGMSDKPSYPLKPAVKKMPFRGMSDKQTSPLKPAV